MSPFSKLKRVTNLQKDPPIYIDDVRGVVTKKIVMTTRIIGRELYKITQVLKRIHKYSKELDLSNRILLFLSYPRSHKIAFETLLQSTFILSFNPPPLRDSLNQTSTGQGKEFSSLINY